MIRKLLPTALLLLMGFTLYAQRQITGTVYTNDSGKKESIPGVSVSVKGTNNGTITDENGLFSLSVGDNENELVFSSIGYQTKTVDITNQSKIDVELASETKSLDEVVVVGYGTQKSKDLTSAVATVDINELAKSPAAQPLQALQGKVPGVQIVNNGSPGATPTIRIRGIGSYIGGTGNTKDVVNISPLYVVDGMLFDNIDFLNTSDIASISILKDASAAAIYGVRAANGVVLITTKSGKFNQKTEVSYDGYYGVQVAQNVLKMANADQFSTMAYESGYASDTQYILNAMQRYGRSRVNPNAPDVNTDWYKEIMRVAPIQSHSLNFAGGSDKTNYALGGNYFSQQGILRAKSDYQRFNLRAKLDSKLNKWLSMGGSMVLSNIIQNTDSLSAWQMAYYAVPVIPVYDKLNTSATPKNYSSATVLGYRDGQNPFPILDLDQNYARTTKVLASMYAKIQIIPNKLSFQTTFNQLYSSTQVRATKAPYYVTTTFQRPNGDLVKQNIVTDNRIIDNLLSYEDNFGEHAITVLVGNSFRRESYSLLKAQGVNYPSTQGTNSWYINKSQSKPSTGVSDEGRILNGLSFFTRVGYNYKDKYLFYGTFRADGTQKYQQKWGYFPSVGLGWVISEESFLKGKYGINFLKIRGSWGLLGNDKLLASAGSNTSGVVQWAINNAIASGTIASNTFNYLRWEKTAETNVGITGRALKDRLSFDIDYYVRDTKDAVIPIIAPGTGDTYYRNAGVIRNSGFEFAATWSDKLPSGFGYHIGGNITTLKNQVRQIYGQPYLYGGTAEFRQITKVGEPINAFYGYHRVGVFQNVGEVNSDANAVSNKLMPGDFKYEDLNGDGKIDDYDRKVLGSYFPNLTFGANIGASYKNFELSVNLMGQSGNKILNRKRGNYLWTTDGNMDADLAKNRWHGEGTTNLYPSSHGLRNGYNLKMSDFLVENGGFFRIQTIQLAYNIPTFKVASKSFSMARVYFTAERPYTYFKYQGFNPEVANGFDDQTYPIPAIYSLGVNLKF